MLRPLATLALLSTLSTPAFAQSKRPPECALSSPTGDLRVHLLTVSPGDQLFTAMGHTAVAFSGGGLNEPVVYSWGAFDGKQDGLLLKFLSGRLPYYVSEQSWGHFWKGVKKHDRTLVGQVLDIPQDQAASVLGQAHLSAAPENREYVYHWAEANCSTKARNVVNDLTRGAFFDLLQGPASTTARQEGFRHLHRWPVLSFAWRFEASSYLDKPITEWERLMLPEHLMREVAKAEVSFDGAAPVPLAKATCVMNDGTYGFAPATPPAKWPWMLPGLLGSALVLLSSAQVDKLSRARRWTGLLAGMYGLVLAVLGTSGVLLWAISSLDGVGPSENFLLAGPQTWALVWAGERFSQGRPLGDRLEKAIIAVAALGLLTLPINLLPWFNQDNGHMVLALLPGLVASVAALVGHDRKA